MELEQGIVHSSPVKQGRMYGVASPGGVVRWGIGAILWDVVCQLVTCACGKMGSWKASRIFGRGYEGESVGHRREEEYM